MSCVLHLQELLDKLVKARDSRAVVVSHPSAVKSFVLKFAEIMDTLDRQHMLSTNGDDKKKKKKKGGMFGFLKGGRCVWGRGRGERKPWVWARVGGAGCRVWSTGCRVCDAWCRVVGTAGGAACLSSFHVPLPSLAPPSGTLFLPSPLFLACPPFIAPPPPLSPLQGH